MTPSDKKFIILVVALVIVILFMGNSIISFAVSNRVSNRFIGELGSRIEFLEKQQLTNVQDISNLKVDKVEAKLFISLISIVYDQNQILRDMGEAARLQNIKKYNVLLRDYEELNGRWQENFWKIKNE